MSRHPAPDELLLDYAAGALPDGPALAVALHVALDPQSQRTVDRLNAVGGALLDREPATALDDSALERALARLDAVPVEPRPAAPARRTPAFDWAPAPLAPHLRPGMDWRRVMGKFDEIRLDLPGDFHRVSLLRLESGRGPAGAQACGLRVHGRPPGRLHGRDRQLRRRRFRGRTGRAEA
jgi:putative transcriptional regulator